MERDEKGVIKWVSTRNLYRDDLWYKLRACLKAFGIVALILFVILLAVFGFADGFSLKMFVLPGEIAGGVFLLFAALTLPSLFLFAWANGGVDEWEYEMDARGINGRKIAHNQGRLKFLRSIAWIMMLFPMKPGQRVTLYNFLHDRGKKDLHVDLIMLRGVSGDEKKCKISIDTFNGATDIFVPHEDYAEVLTFLEGRLPKRKKKGKKR